MADLHKVERGTNVMGIMDNDNHLLDGATETPWSGEFNNIHDQDWLVEHSENNDEDYLQFNLITEWLGTIGKKN